MDGGHPLGQHSQGGVHGQLVGHVRVHGVGGQILREARLQPVDLLLDALDLLDQTLEGTTWL